MPKPQPLECPACGHDRILQRPRELFTATRRIRVQAANFCCGLCRYQWSVPARPTRADEWELV